MLAANHLLIYTEKSSARLAYIVSVLFQGKASITNNQGEFIAYAGARINYSETNIEGVACHIYPHELLMQDHIVEQEITLFRWQDKPVFFKTPGTIPFDLFAAAFYLITRYEEWLPHQSDELGRYNPVQSLAYRHGFLQLPMINIWLGIIANDFNFKWDTYFSFRPSYDIDIAYSYLHHSSFRNVLGYFKQLINLQFNQLIERMQVLAGAQKDPYDIYDWLDLLHDSLQLKPLYFFLLSPKRNKLHKNISPASTAMKNLMNHHAGKYTVGIHPSIDKNYKVDVLIKEKQLLAHIINKPVTHSRQHYIHMRFPETYSNLIQAGMEADYSMGYPQINGFRASYTYPFKWFNLATNECTSLTVYPFCYMDATAIFKEKKTPSEALQILDDFFGMYKKYGGVFIPIFHNNFLTTQAGMIDWKNLYADFLLKHCTK